MNKEVTSYINESPEEQQKIMNKIRELINESVPESTEEFKWSRPVFRSHHDFAYLKKAKAYVTLGFFKFQKIDDKENKLQGTGKDMRHIKLKTTGDINEEELKEWFKASAE